MSVSVTPSVLIVTVPLAGWSSAGSIEMSASVTFPVEMSYAFLNDRIYSHIVRYLDTFTPKILLLLNSNA